NRLYVSIGSAGNVDAATGTTPPATRAQIRRYNLAAIPSGGYDIGAGEVFASGLRNEVGMTLDSQGRLWGVENGRDNLLPHPPATTLRPPRLPTPPLSRSPSSTPPARSATTAPRSAGARGSPPARWPRGPARSTSSPTPRAASPRRWARPPAWSSRRRSRCAR